MTEATRKKINTLVNSGFGKTLHRLRQAIPSVSMETYNHNNPTFPFRTYAQYSAGGHTIVISVDVKAINKELLFSSDIARENGAVLKDIMDVSVDDNPDGESRLINHIREFAATCETHASLIERELASPTS